MRGRKRAVMRLESGWLWWTRKELEREKGWRIKYVFVLLRQIKAQSLMQYYRTLCLVCQKYPPLHPQWLSFERKH